MKQTSVDPEPTENKGSMHFKRQQKMSILEQAEYKSSVGVIQFQKAFLVYHSWLSDQSESWY